MQCGEGGVMPSVLNYWFLGFCSKLLVYELCIFRNNLILISAGFNTKSLFLTFLTTYNNHYNKIKYLPSKQFFYSPTNNNKHVFKLKILYFSMALIRIKLIYFFGDHVIFRIIQHA